MDYGNFGMSLRERRNLKELTRMGKKMVYGLGGMKIGEVNGMKVDRRATKKLTRMGN